MKTKSAHLALLTLTLACGDDGNTQTADPDQTRWCNKFHIEVLGEEQPEPETTCSCFGSQPSVGQLEDICEDDETKNCIDDIEESIFSDGSCAADTGTGGPLPPMQTTGEFPGNDCEPMLNDGSCCSDEYTDCCDGVLCSNYDFENFAQRAPVRGAPYSANFGSGSTIELIFADGEAWEDSANSSLTGSIQYAYMDCGETKCPFFLYGALIGATTPMSIDIKVGATTLTKVVSNLSLRLLYPVLGVHNTTNDEGWFSRRSIVWVIEFDLSGSQFGSENGHYARVSTSTNDSTTSNNPSTHSFTFDNLSFDLGAMAGIDLLANVTQDMALAESPPAANATVNRTCSSPGHAFVEFESTSTDPDSDIAYEVWRINDTPEAVGSEFDTTLANGSYKWALTVYDDRGGFNVKYGSFVIACA